MQTQRVFTNVDDEVLEARIRCATGRIVYVAPGISVRVARALAHRAVAGDGAEISVVLDVDAEVCRLGYGDLAGLETIKAAMEQTGRRVWHQAGIRMGLLICDEDVLVYAPTPLLIEAGSGVPEKPNGVLLEEGKTAAVEDACGVSGDAARQEVGLDPELDWEIGIEPSEGHAPDEAPPILPLTQMYFGRRYFPRGPAFFMTSSAAGGQLEPLTWILSLTVLSL